ncbi:hypothetical protein [Piscinibacter terrae]|nr:hypothetical protein [Albitalea terrae]
MAFAVHAQTLPPGWQSRPGAEGRLVFSPVQPGPGEFTEVTFSARSSMNGQSVDKWLAAALINDTPPPGGTWQGPPSIKADTLNTAQGTRMYRDNAGGQGFAIYMAVSLDQSNARYARWVVNSEATGRRYTEAGKSLMAQLPMLEKRGANEEHRAVRVEPPPPGVKGMRAGGAIVAGRYEGDAMSGKTFMYHVVLLVHANGEYEFVQGGGNASNPGTYRYQPGSGKLDVAVGLFYNSTYRPDENFCVFGRDANGQPVIYAEEDYGVSVHRAWLRRVGEVDRPPHTAVEAARMAADVEAARYQFVTEPGKGVPMSEIETLYYAWSQVYTVGGMKMEEAVYLLLKDGTVRDGLPVAPTELDVATSRRREPLLWGRWRKQGGDYVFTWDDKSNHFEKAQGFALVPAAKGTRLDGRWSTSASFGFVGGASSWSKTTLVLGKDGRFEKMRAGGAAAGGPGSSSDTMVSTVHDDKGAVSSGTGPGFAVGSQRKAADKGDRTGSYEIDGFNITLRHDDGTVIRQPFAIEPKNRSVWFGGSLMSSK